MIRGLIVATAFALAAVPAKARSAFDGAECYVTTMDSVASSNDYMIGPWATLADCQEELAHKRQAEGQGWNPASMIPPPRDPALLPGGGEGRATNAAFDEAKPGKPEVSAAAPR